MSEDLIRRVEAACEELAHSGERLTFTNVAERAGVARPTLYRNPNLRAVVEEHRVRSSEALTLSQLTTQIAHLRQSLEAVAEKVRRHEEELRRLRSPRPRR